MTSPRLPQAALDVRAKLLERLGPPRAHAPATPPKIDRRFASEGVLYERWHIAGPHGEIPAWFLRPEGGAGALPVVVALHPHGRQFELGKSLVAGLVGDGTRAYGLTAAQAGFAVLIPDMLAFEDHRPPLAARKTNYALQGEAYERLLAVEALARGESLQGWMMSELYACAEALEREPRVDAARMALAGQSFGGQQAIFGMVCDARFRAGIVSCGFSLVHRLIERRISHNFALYVPGMLPGLDFDALVPAIAPRPLFVIAGRRDAIFPVDGVELVEKEARRAWKECGAPDAVHFRYLEGGHDLPADTLSEALTWLRGVL